MGRSTCRGRGNDHRVADLEGHYDLVGWRGSRDVRRSRGDDAPNEFSARCGPLLLVYIDNTYRLCRRVQLVPLVTQGLALLLVHLVLELA